MISFLADLVDLSSTSIPSAEPIALKVSVDATELAKKGSRDAKLIHSAVGNFEMSKKADSNPGKATASLEKVLGDFFFRTPVERNQSYQHGCEAAARHHRSHALSSPSKSVSDYQSNNSVLLPRTDSPSRSQCDCVSGPQGVRDADGIIRPPFGDVRDPTGSFYGPFMERVKASYAGAAGNSRTILGHHSASKYHKDVFQGAQVPKRDFTPDSARSNILRTSSHCM